MIIEYKVRNIKNGEEIQLCGKFKDVNHFVRFQMVEEYRGWKVIQTSVKVLKEGE